MHLSVGPIFWIELVTAARRTRYFVLRSLYAAVLLLMFWSAYASYTQYRGAPDDIGTVARLTAAFFTGFSVIQLVAVLVIGPAMVAGTIATERERRTIEYLFASSLGNAEIVLSKLAARLVQILYFLLTGLPILATAMLLGGIAPEALVVVYAITTSTVLAVSAVAMAGSVWTPRARDAVMRVYLTVIVLLIVPLVVLSLAWTNAPVYANYVAPVNDRFLEANPLWVLNRAQELASGANPELAWELVGVLVRDQAIFSVALLAAAVVSVRWVHLRRAGKGDRPRRERFCLWRPAIGDRPMLWKELFAGSAASRLGWVGRLLIFVLLGCVFVPVLWQFHTILDSRSSQRWEIQSFLMMVVFFSMAVSCGTFLLIAARAASSITAERERDSWDSLLSTPLSAREIVLAKMLGSLWDVRLMLLPLGALWGLGLLIQPAILPAALGSLAVFAILALFAAVLGTFLSLVSKTSLRAMGATLALGVFLGGGYMFCCVPCIWGGGGGRGSEIILAGCIPFLQLYPGLVAIEPHSSQGEVTAAFAMGVVGYLIASGVLLAMAMDTFDYRTGRASVRGYHPPEPRPAALCGPAAIPTAPTAGEVVPAGVLDAEVLDENEGNEEPS